MTNAHTHKAIPDLYLMIIIHYIRIGNWDMKDREKKVGGEVVEKGGGEEYTRIE